MSNATKFVNGAQQAALATLERVADVGLARPALYIERRLDERAGLQRLQAKQAA